MHMPKSVIVGSFMVFIVALYGAQAFAQNSIDPDLQREPAQSFLIDANASRENPASLGHSPATGEAASTTSVVVLPTSSEPQQNSVARPQPSQRVAAEAPTSKQESQDTIQITQEPKNISQTRSEPTAPVRVLIPKISLNSPVVQVGLTSDGAMDVPSGKTNDVGWYKGGTVPGNQGSAVLDAHVFAAFGRLHELNVGDEVYVTDKDGVSRRFIVEEATVYALKDVPAERLFNRADTKRVNLITCAGKLTADHSTYTHRLIVYAVLAE